MGIKNKTIKLFVKNNQGLYKDLTYKIIGALYVVHNELGSVHKENIYHRHLS
ncbi:MAG: hypothetical protein JSV97_04680 [candidate division WOR-3 bacterium]|nr:MAG: hypothetical protein JSV97_04680 [candidate division WOR-3 bacterium]